MGPCLGVSALGGAFRAATEWSILCTSLGREPAQVGRATIHGPSNSAATEGRTACHQTSCQSNLAPSPLQGDEADNAINMYKKARQFDQMIRLVAQHRKDNLLQVCVCICVCVCACVCVCECMFGYVPSKQQSSLHGWWGGGVGRTYALRPVGHPHERTPQSLCLAPNTCQGPAYPHLLVGQALEAA